MKTRASCGLVWKATLALFPLRPVLYLGQIYHSCAKFSVYTCCFQSVSVGLNPLKTFSQLWGNWFGIKMSYFHKHGIKEDSKLGQSLPNGKLTNSTKQEYGSFLICKVYSTQGMNTNPNVCWLWKATLDFFPLRPLIHQGQMTQRAAQRFLCTGLVQGVSIIWKATQMGSPSWKSLIWHENAIFSQVG